MIVIGDLHLGRMNDVIESGDMNSRLKDSVNRLQEVIDVASKDDDSIIIAGDVFNSDHPWPYVIEEFTNIIKYAWKNSVDIYVMPGNHDCGANYYSFSFIRELLPSTIVIDEPRLLRINSMSVLFLPHMIRRKMDEMKDGYLDYAMRKVNKDYLKLKGTKIDLVVGHAHVSGAKNASDVEIEAGDALRFDPSNMFGFKLAVFGHIHRHQELKNGRILYTGPVVTNDFSEGEIEKGYIKVGKENTKMFWNFVPFKSPETQYKTIIIDLVSKDKVNLDEKKLEPLCKGKLIKVKVYATDVSKINEVEIRKRMNEFGNVMRFETIISDKLGDTEIDDLVVEQVFEKVNYKPVFENWVKEKKYHKEERDLVLNLGNEVIEEVLNAKKSEN